MGPDRYQGFLWVIYMVLVFITGYVINGVIHLVEVIVRRIRRKK